MEHTTADAIATALDELTQGSARTRPISVSLPGPLLDALQSLAQDGRISSTSAAVTEALTKWLHNKLLRLTLDEIYDEHPDLRPTPERVAAMAQRVGIAVPHQGDEVA
ncbi:MAG: ribbon-helix-helix domain-containing protein [Pseudonocardiaceae bacterium]